MLKLTHSVGGRTRQPWRWPNATLECSPVQSTRSTTSTKRRCGSALTRWKIGGGKAHGHDSFKENYRTYKRDRNSASYRISPFRPSHLSHVFGLLQCRVTRTTAYAYNFNFVSHTCWARSVSSVSMIHSDDILREVELLQLN